MTRVSSSAGPPQRNSGLNITAQPYLHRRPPFVPRLFLSKIGKTLLQEPVFKWKLPPAQHQGIRAVVGLAARW
jgi:hypothetical protein